MFASGRHPAEGNFTVEQHQRDELEASVAPGAALAIDYFVYRIALFAGMLAAALGGLDAFVFTAGIAENSVLIRTRVAEKLSWLGASLDADANTAAKLLISQPHSKICLYVVPTEEELMIAQHTIGCLKQVVRIAAPFARRQNAKQ